MAGNDLTQNISCGCINLGKIVFGLANQGGIVFCCDAKAATANSRVTISETFVIYPYYGIPLKELVKRGNFYRTRSALKLKDSRGGRKGTRRVEATLVNFGQLMDVWEVRVKFRELGLRLAGPRDLLAWERTDPYLVVAPGFPVRSSRGARGYLFVYPYSPSRSGKKWGLGLAVGRRWGRETWFMGVKSRSPLTA